jgi:hypothetical protein
MEITCRRIRYPVEKLPAERDRAGRGGGQVHRSLEWRRFGIEEKLGALGEGIRATRERVPAGHTRDRAKMERWSGDLETISRGVAVVRSRVKPRVERDLGYPLGRTEMFVISFFQPSTKNLFSEIGVHFRAAGGCTLTEDDLAALARLPDVAAALAWIGDAALKIGVLPEIWTPDVAEAGQLTERRRRYDSNTNEALLCDRWHLYEHRIHLDTGFPAANPVHEKGTLVEAIFGVIFLQGGLSAVADAARLLRPSSSAAPSPPLSCRGPGCTRPRGGAGWSGGKGP